MVLTNRGIKNNVFLAVVFAENKAEIDITAEKKVKAHGLPSRCCSSLGLLLLPRPNRTLQRNSTLWAK